MRLLLVALLMLLSTSALYSSRIEKIYSADGTEVGSRVVVTPEDVEKKLTEAGSVDDKCGILLDLVRMYGAEERLDKVADTLIRREETCPSIDTSQISAVSLPPLVRQSELIDILGRILSTRDKLPGTKLFLVRLCVQLERKDDAAKYMKLAMKAAWDDPKLFARVWHYAGWNAGLPQDMISEIALRMHQMDPKDQDAANRVVFQYMYTNDAKGQLQIARDILKDINDGDALVTAAGILHRAEDWAAAADAYKKSGKLDKLNGIDSRNYIQACSKANRVFEAIAFCNQLMARSATDNDRAGLYWDMFQIYQDRKDYPHMAQYLIQWQDPSPDGWGRQVLCSVSPDMAKPLADALSAALQVSGKHPISQIEQAWIYMCLKDYDKWRTMITKVVADYPQDTYVLGMVMEACTYDQSSWQIGVDVGRSVVKQPPVSQANWQRFAMLCEYGKLEGEAVEAARSLVRGWPNNYSATENARSIFCHYDRWDDAIDAARKAVAASPSDSEYPKLELARTYSASGRYSEAVPICHKLVAATKDMSTKSQCQSLLAYIGTKDPGSSLEDGTRALVEAMRAGDGTPVLRILGGLRSKQTSRGTMWTLAKSLEALPTADRQVPLCSALLGGLYETLGRQKDAMSVIAPVLPKIRDWNLLDCLKAIAIEQRDGLLDLAVCKRLVEVKPDDWRSWDYLAGSYELLGNKGEACKIARSYAKEFRNDPDAMHYAANILSWGGSYKQAEALLNQAIVKADELAATGKPSNIHIRRDVWGSMQVLYHRSGQKDKEIDYLRKLLTVPNYKEGQGYISRRLKELGAVEGISGVTEQR